MTELTLHFAPGSCSRIPTVAFDELGIPFEARLVRFMRGDHRSEGYLRLNPKGKVPLLLVDGQPLSENVAILSYLAKAYPESNLLPFGRSFFEDSYIISLLAWCSSGMHPIITRIRLPQMYCSTADGQDSVRGPAMVAMKEYFAIVDRLLYSQEWILREWSAVDAFLYWIWFRATGFAFDASGFVDFAAHAATMESRVPSRTVDNRAERTSVSDRT